MPIHLRQICLVARELQPAVDDLSEILGIRTCHIDPAVGKWGLENALVPIGTDFLEVVAPIQDGTSAGRHLQRRGGDGGYMVICQADSPATQAEVMARAEANKVRIAFERENPNWHIVQFHPADMRASFLEVDSDDVNDFTGNWHPAGGLGWEDSVTTETSIAMNGVELQAKDPAALAQHWSAVLGLSVENSAGPPRIPLANGNIRFVQETDGRGPGLSGVDLQVRSIDQVLANAEQRGCPAQTLPQGSVAAARVTMCGTHFYLSE